MNDIPGGEGGISILTTLTSSYDIEQTIFRHKFKSFGL